MGSKAWQHENSSSIPLPPHFQTHGGWRLYTHALISTMAETGAACLHYLFIAGRCKPSIAPNSNCVDKISVVFSHSPPSFTIFFHIYISFPTKPAKENEGVYYMQEKGTPMALEFVWGKEGEQWWC